MFRIARVDVVLALLLGAALPAMAENETDDVAAIPADLAPRFREWLAQVEMLLTEEERAYFLSLDEADPDTVLRTYDTLFPVLLYRPAWSDHYLRWLPVEAQAQVNEKSPRPSNFSRPSVRTCPTGCRSAIGAATAPSTSPWRAADRARRFECVRDLPLNAALVIDVSASMEDSIDRVSQAAQTFVEEVIQPRDRATLIAFNHQPDVRARFTNDVAAAPSSWKTSASSIRSMPPSRKAASGWTSMTSTTAWPYPGATSTRSKDFKSGLGSLL